MTITAGQSQKQALRKNLLVFVEQIFPLTNRKMAEYLFFFSLFSGVSVSYKTVERAIMIIIGK